MTALIALAGGIGSVVGYRLIADGPRWTRLLLLTLTVSLLLGGTARMVRIVGDPGMAAVPIALLGPMVTFTGVCWWLANTPRATWWRGLVVIAGGAAAAVLGYLSIDLLGLAYLKLPRFG